jgi:hypothetical protein
MASFCVFVLWFCDPWRVLFERGLLLLEGGLGRGVCLRLGFFFCLRR